jgi:hypothetical protein
MATFTFHGYTVIHYTTWEYSYQAISTLTLTFADYKRIGTRSLTMVDGVRIARPMVRTGWGAWNCWE